MKLGEMVVERYLSGINFWLAYEKIDFSFVFIFLGGGLLPERLCGGRLWGGWLLPERRASGRLWGGWRFFSG
jgi:hypothetical protein